MKIALIDPSLFTWPYDVHLAKGLEASGHKVAIFGRNPGRRLEADDQRYLRQHFYPFVETPVMRQLPSKIFLALKGLSHIESMARLIVKLKSWQPDVIHFQWAPLPVVDRRFLPFFRSIAPIVLTVHDPAPFNNNPRAGLQKFDSIGIMKSFDQLIVHTENARQRVIGYGVGPNKINVVPHGLLADENVVPIPVEKVKDGTVTMLVFGQIKPYKGIDVLLRALAYLTPEMREKCRVKIVGKPQMPMGPLQALAEDLGVKHLVKFDLRYVPDDEIRSLMSSADIQLFPYREIDASGVLMLALPSARPIVASNIGLFGELLEDRVHGALVRPDDPGALAAGMAPLIESELLRDQAAAEVRRLADKIPKWKEIGVLTTKVYERGRLSH